MVDNSQNRRSKPFIPALVAVLLVFSFLCPTPLLADGDCAQGNVFTWTGYGGNYVGGSTAAGVGTGTVDTLGVPAGATIVKSYLYYHRSNGDASYPVFLDGFPLTINKVGSATCGFWQITPYRVDVTALVVPRMTLTVSGLPGGGFDAVYLVTIYEDLNQTCLTTVVLADGANGWDWGNGFAASPVTMDWSAEGNPVGQVPHVRVTWIGTPGNQSEDDNADYWTLLDAPLTTATQLWRSASDSVDNSTANMLDIDSFDLSAYFTTGDEVAYMWGTEYDDAQAHWNVSIVKNTNCDDAGLVGVIKSASPTTPVPAGTEVTYTLCYYNHDPADIDNVVMTDNVPAEINYVGADPGVSVALPALTWNIGTLPGAYVYHTLSIWIDAVTTVGGWTTSGNVVGAGIGYDGLPANSLGTGQMWVTYEHTGIDGSGGEVIDTVIFHQRGRTAGNDDIRYRWYSNNCSGARTLDLPQAVFGDFAWDVSFDCYWAWNEINLMTSWFMRQQASGGGGSDNVDLDSAYFEVIYHTFEPVTVCTQWWGEIDGSTVNDTVIPNTAYIDTPYQNPFPSDAPVTVSAYALTISKSANPTLVTMGDIVTYTVVYDNLGADVAGVVLTDLVPTDTTYLGCSGGSKCDESGGTVSWTIGNVSAGESGTVQFWVEIDTY